MVLIRVKIVRLAILAFDVAFESFNKNRNFVPKLLEFFLVVQWDRLSQLSNVFLAGLNFVIDFLDDRRKHISYMVIHDIGEFSNQALGS